MTTTANPAEKIRQLREKTGAGMMDCKKALDEAAGDFDKAVEGLRKKGLADAAKKSSRTTKEGLVAAYVTPDGKQGGIIELDCETDFVAKTDEFQKAAADFAKLAAEGKLPNAEAVDAEVKGLIAKLGENMVLKRVDRFEAAGAGRIAFYVHGAGSKKGAMLELSAESEAVAKHEAVDSLAKELGMQITAMSPRWTRREEVSDAAIAKEKEIFAEQIRAEGKPEASIAKIVEGKVNKLFYQQWVLLEQMSMRDNKTPVKDLLAQAGKAAGGAVEVKRFVRYQLGGE
ncbi:MAG: translation elongation factor Ts [Elusimicrobia bacterium]|nr:translation elongation factor Ts [Elusimicrobiota bacterium]